MSKSAGLTKELNRLFAHLPRGTNLMQRYVAAKAEGCDLDPETDKAFTAMIIDVLAENKTDKHSLQTRTQRGPERSLKPFEAAFNYYWARQAGIDKAVVIEELCHRYGWKPATLKRHIRENQHRAKAAVGAGADAFKEMARVKTH